MKKHILSLAILSLFYTESNACAWADPDYDYFNLFTQTIIKDKSYLPFLHSYSTRFYTEFDYTKIPDENIAAWKQFFNNHLSYAETDYLVNKMSMNDLNALKKGNPTNQLLKKLGPGFYQKYYEGIDYLIEAKYLEPFMRINFVENPDSFYYNRAESDKNATNLDYNKTISALTSLYNAAKNTEIKQRYGYQLVRFNHYTRNYDKALQAFKTYVEPIHLKGAPYIMALDQLAGVQRGLQMNSDANWNFFQVFMKSKSRKESAFVSMKLSDTASFNNIMKRAGNNEEKNMAYFLLGYEDFANPIPLMEKMYDINPDSEILKVMAARSINELERSYLPTYYYASDDIHNPATQKADSGKQTDQPEVKEVKKEKLSFWDKIVRFFKNLFGDNTSDKKEDNKKSDQSDDELLENPNRIPFYTQNTGFYWSEEKPTDFLGDLSKFTEKTKDKSKDEFWQIADAYLKFLSKDYEGSTDILNEIKTNNPEYLEEIKRMKVLNDIVSQPKITAEYEDHLMKNYAEYFVDKKPVTTDSINSDYNNYYGPVPSTASFLKDVLANRYYLQGEDGKSFLMSNKLSDLQYNPNSSLVKSVEEFYKKPNKTKFEQQIIAKNMDDVGNIDAFFSVIYGDRAMRTGDFAKARSDYQKAQGFVGIPRLNYDWVSSTQPNVPHTYAPNEYNGFRNIPDLVFGHNVWESFQSAASDSMAPEDYSQFPFIKQNMNKLELADALIQLTKIANGKDAKSAKANQLIGNLLYNTSILGYYRHLFVMDVDNTNGGKFDFWSTKNKTPYQYYYKNFLSTSYIEPDNFDLAINYYKKALEFTPDQEQKARILFQMASAEQGKYYQYEAKNPVDSNYSDPKWSEKNEAHEKQLQDIKNQKFRTYFALLKTQYANTETAKSLMGSCSYFDYFMKR